MNLYSRLETALLDFSIKTDYYFNKNRTWYHWLISTRAVSLSLLPFTVAHNIIHGLNGTAYGIGALITNKPHWIEESEEMMAFGLITSQAAVFLITFIHPYAPFSYRDKSFEACEKDFGFDRNKPLNEFPIELPLRGPLTERVYIHLLTDKSRLKSFAALFILPLARITDLALGVLIILSAIFLLGTNKKLNDLSAKCFSVGCILHDITYCLLTLKKSFTNRL